MDQFQELPNNPVNVSHDEMYNYVIEKLDDFDKLTEMTGAEPANSPYRDSIEYALPDGKLIEIPKYIQLKAVKEWMVQKGMIQNDNVNQQPNYQISPIQQQKQINSFRNSSTSNKIFWIVVVAIFVFLLVWYIKVRSA